VSSTFTNETTGRAAITMLSSPAVAAVLARGARAGS